MVMLHDLVTAITRCCNHSSRWKINNIPSRYIIILKIKKNFLLTSLCSCADFYDYYLQIESIGSKRGPRSSHLILLSPRENFPWHLCQIHQIKKNTSKEKAWRTSMKVQYICCCTYSMSFLWLYHNWLLYLNLRLSSGKSGITGSLTRDFRLQVFFINQCPLGLGVSHWDHFEFFRKFAGIFANECLSALSTTPAKKIKVLR